MSQTKQISSTKTLAIAAIVGFVVAMIVMAVAIYFGYSNAYRSGMGSMSVSLVGFDIYELQRAGDQYIGTSMGLNLGIVCVAFIALAIVIERIITKTRAAKSSGKNDK